MSYKILITISDELKVMIDKYNQENPFEPLHISEISAKAIYDRLTSGRERTIISPYEEVPTCKTIKTAMKVKPGPLHKALTPVHENVHKLNFEPNPETKEQACAADFFSNECDTTEKTEEEPIQEAPITKPKMEK